MRNDPNQKDGDIDGLDIVDRLPKYFHPDQGAAIPRELIGAKLIRIGTPRDQRKFEGGGLVIDYIPAKSRKVKRIILSFSELEMWIQSVATLSA